MIYNISGVTAKDYSKSINFNLKGARRGGRYRCLPLRAGFVVPRCEAKTFTMATLMASCNYRRCCAGV